MDKAKLPIERQEKEQPPRRDGKRARWSPPTVQKLDVVKNTAGNCCGMDVFAVGS